MPRDKLRPGVLSARKLASVSDALEWAKVEEAFDGVSLTDPVLQQQRNELSNQLLSKYDAKETKHISLSKAELLSTVLEWKFNVGKVRPAVRNLVHQNANNAVRNCTHLGFAAAMNINRYTKQAATDALEAVCKLKGIGPAGASAVLSLLRPDLYAYMYDEVIETFCPKRVYTLPTYHIMNERCMEKAEELSSEGDTWTAHRVATVLWMSARLAAHHGASIDPPAKAGSGRKRKTTEMATLPPGRETVRLPAKKRGSQGK